MNLAETHDLLAFIAAYDNRRFDDATVLAWQPILADASFDDCRTAVIRHFGTSTDYLMPVHVRRGADELDRDRRRIEREAREHLAVEALGVTHDRSDDVRALIAELRDRLPEGDPDKLHRPEVVEWERQKARATRADAGPNPLYDPASILTREDPDA